jgi:hypothetical protein
MPCTRDRPQHRTRAGPGGSGSEMTCGASQRSPRWYWKQNCKMARSARTRTFHRRRSASSGGAMAAGARTPGCRSTRGLEIHHIVARSQGGSNDPRNLTLRCDLCLPCRASRRQDHDLGHRAAPAARRATSRTGQARRPRGRDGDGQCCRGAGGDDGGGLGRAKRPRGRDEWCRAYRNQGPERVRRDRHAHAGTRCASWTGLEAAHCEGSDPGRLRGDRGSSPSRC